jgi:hypothetical protein
MIRAGRLRQQGLNSQWQTRRAVFGQKLKRTQNFRFSLNHQNIREGGG